MIPLKSLAFLLQKSRTIGLRHALQLLRGHRGRHSVRTAVLRHTNCFRLTWGATLLLLLGLLLGQLLGLLDLLLGLLLLQLRLLGLLGLLGLLSLLLLSKSKLLLQLLQLLLLGMLRVLRVLRVLRHLVHGHWLKMGRQLLRSKAQVNGRRRKLGDVRAGRRRVLGNLVLELVRHWLAVLRLVVELRLRRRRGLLVHRQNLRLDLLQAHEPLCRRPRGGSLLVVAVVVVHGLVLLLRRAGGRRAPQRHVGDQRRQMRGLLHGRRGLGGRDRAEGLLLLGVGTRVDGLLLVDDIGNLCGGAREVKVAVCDGKVR